MLECIFQICVIKDEGWGFAPEFQRAMFEVAFGGGNLDLATCSGGSCKGDFRNVHVPGQHSTNFASTSDNVDNTWREASFFYELAKGEGSERGLFRRLEDHGVACSDCWSGLHTQLVYRLAVQTQVYFPSM
jgi:hypothetical protein